MSAVGELILLAGRYLRLVGQSPTRIAGLLGVAEVKIISAGDTGFELAGVLVAADAAQRGLRNAWKFTIP